MNERCKWPHCRALGTILLQGKDFCDEHQKTVLDSVSREADLAVVLLALRNIGSPKAPKEH